MLIRQNKWTIPSLTIRTLELLLILPSRTIHPAIVPTFDILKSLDYFNGGSNLFFNVRRKHSFHCSFDFFNSLVNNGVKTNIYLLFLCYFFWHLVKAEPGIQ